MKQNGHSSPKGISSYLFILPAVILFLSFIAYPIFWLLAQSISHTAEHSPASSYLKLLKDPVFWLAVRNMALWGLLTIPLQMIMGGTIAYLIEFYTSKWRSFFRTMYFLPVITSVSVVSIVWTQIYTPYYGIGQRYLSWFGIVLENSPIGDTRMAIYALILVNIWQWTGFSMLLYIAGFVNFPKETLSAARIDGAVGLALAFRIIVPMVSYVTRSLLLLGIMGSLQTFPIVFLMTGGGPNHASEIFGTYIFKKAFITDSTGEGAALSLIVIAIALALSCLQAAWFGKKSRH